MRKSSYFIIKPLDFTISCRMDHFTESNHQKLIFFGYFLNISKNLSVRFWCYWVYMYVMWNCSALSLCLIAYLDLFLDPMTWLLWSCSYKVVISAKPGRKTRIAPPWGYWKQRQQIKYHRKENKDRTTLRVLETQPTSRRMSTGVKNSSTVMGYGMQSYSVK